MENYTDLRPQVREALGAFLHTEPDALNADSVDLVTDLVEQAQFQRAAGNFDYAESLLEKSSTYVYCDMSEEELEVYVSLLEDYALSY